MLFVVVIVEIVDKPEEIFCELVKAFIVENATVLKVNMVLIQMRVQHIVKIQSLLSFFAKFLDALVDRFNA